MLNVHIYPSPLTHESRILRITDALAQAGMFSRIEVIGVARTDLPSIEKIDGLRTLIRLPRKTSGLGDGFFAKLVRTTEWSMRVLATISRRKISCINAHSLAVLPLCVVASKISGARLVYDTHELETETTGYTGLRQKLGRVVEKLLIRHCDMVVCVSDSIADWYESTYSITRPVVVRNIPQFSPSSLPNQIVSRAEMGLRLGKLAFIYQGGFIEGRGVERLLRLFCRLPELDLVCMGSGPLLSLVEDAARNHNNIHLFPPVPPDKVLSYSQLADIGICLTDNSCLSHYYSLPNKIFEYLHAGLPIIVNPLVEQKAVVERFDCGWVATDEDSALATMLTSINHDAIAAKHDGVLEAKKVLNWDNEKAVLVRAYQEHGFV